MMVRKLAGAVSWSELTDESTISLAGIRVGHMEHQHTRVGGGLPFLQCLTIGIAEIGKHSSAVFRSYKINMNLWDRSRHNAVMSACDR